MMPEMGKAVEAAVAAVLKDGSFPIYHTQDDCGLERDEYVDFAKRVIAALPATPAGAGWQPIETAPKDQEVEVRGRWKLRGDGVEFTHWRPLVAEQREVK